MDKLNQEFEKLTVEQKAFFANETRSCSTHEAVVRRDELRTKLMNNVIGGNRKAALMAMATLQGFIDPPETAEQKDAKVTDNMVALAQRQANQGDIHLARQTLERIGLDLDVLTDGRPPELVQREERAKSQYLGERELGIARVMKDRGINKQQATRFFDGKAEPLHNMPKESMLTGSPVSLDSELRKTVNRNNSFNVDHEIK
jgi:hypothetical protein